MATEKFATIDQYQASFPKEVQEKLTVFRKTIQETVPKAVEVISYNMPAFKLNKNFVYYSAFKNHISLFPAPGGAEWKKDFEPYKTSGKGTIQFSFDKPIPVALIRKIVKYLAAKDAQKAAKK